MSESHRRIGRTLDIGIADGYTGERLFHQLGMSSYLGYDAKLSEADCAQRSHGGLRFVNALPPAANEFDLVLVRDALELVADDRALLGEVRARVHARGRVLVLVPAFEALFSDYDRELGRHRRYSLEDLCENLTAAGLPVKSTGYLFGSLLAPRVLRRVGDVVKSFVKSGRDRGNEKPGGSLRGNLTRRLLTSALSLENSALITLNARGMKIPGITAWALCDLNEGR